MNPENSSYQSLIDLQKNCLAQRIPFVSYRLPLQKEITTLIQHSSMPEKLDSSFNPDTTSGFVIAPFFETESRGAYILKPDQVFISNNIDKQFIDSLKENSRFISTEQRSENKLFTTAPENFILQVENAKLAIAAGNLHKVVLSKIRTEQLKDDFNVSRFYLEMCELYPHAFVSLIQIPQVGCWVGATPEPLLVITGKKMKTVSLAGTQVATDTDIDSYVWSKKEIEEQGIVTAYVEQTLQSLNIANYTKIGPSNYKAANLIHLKTSFEFEQTNLGKRLDEFLKALHPTPSVGGFPKEAAREFILKNEKHDRAYYTGFLGPVNIEGETNVFVNLRCLQLFEKQFVLYSGAGITASSDAEKEWEETNNKMLTMLNVMNSIPKSEK